MMKDFIDGINSSLSRLNLSELSAQRKFVLEQKVSFRPGAVALDSQDLLNEGIAAQCALSGGPSWVNVTVLKLKELDIVVFTRGQSVGCPEPAFMVGRSEDEVLLTGE